jgi:hypothetical protein
MQRIVYNDVWLWQPGNTGVLTPGNTAAGWTQASGAALAKSHTSNTGLVMPVDECMTMSLADVSNWYEWWPVACPSIRPRLRHTS